MSLMRECTLFAAGDPVSKEARAVPLYLSPVDGNQSSSEAQEDSWGGAVGALPSEKGGGSECATCVLSEDLLEKVHAADQVDRLEGVTRLASGSWRS